MKVACYAAGIIGSSFAVNFAMKGMECSVYVTNDDRAARGTASIIKVLDSMIALGGIPAEERENVLSRIHVTTNPADAFRGVSLIQENGPESPAAKAEIMAVIDRYAPSSAVFASSTSGMSITKIAETALFPERCIGAHPFNPPHLIPLMELTKGEKTEDRYLKKALDIYRMAGKEPIVLQKEKIGFVANRLSHVVLREAMALLAEGVCSVEDMDKALVYGPGIRWASIGQIMVGELGSPGGVKAGMDRFQPMSEGIFRDLYNITHYPDGISSIADKGIAEAKEHMPDCIGHTTEEIAHFRDKVLIELLKLHGKI